MTRRIIFLAYVLFSAPCFAQGFPQATANFSSELRGRRAAFYLNQHKLFESENPSQISRPIWVHGGDSLASAWANSSTLTQRFRIYERTQDIDDSELKNINQFGTSDAFTWYAGDRFSASNFLSHLDRLPESQSTEWVVISTAMATVTLNPTDDENALAALAELPEAARERVQLVTFSLGSNDVCKSETLSSKKIIQELRKLKENYRSDTRIVTFGVWDIPDMYAAKKQIFDALWKLPAGDARAQMIRYCQAQWDLMCPGIELGESEEAQEKRRSFQARREMLRTLLRQEFGELFDVQSALLNNPDGSQNNPLQIVAADCFHPSRLAQPLIGDRFFDFVSAKRQKQSP